MYFFYITLYFQINDIHWQDWIAHWAGEGSCLTPQKSFISYENNKNIVY